MPRTLNPVEQAAAGLLLARCPSELTDAPRVDWMRAAIDQVFVLSDAGLLASSLPEPAPARFRAPVTPGPFTAIEVEVPRALTNAPALARSIAEDLARGETTVSIPAGVTVTYHYAEMAASDSLPS